MSYRMVGAGVGVLHGVLHVAQGHARDQSGGAAGAPQAVRADGVVDPDRPGEPVQGSGR